MQPKVLPRSLLWATRLAAVWLVTGATMHASAGTSSVVSTGSESIGSSSTSIEKSSDSVSGGKRVAQGDYTVIEVAALEQRPEMQRVHLQAINGTDDFYLLLPRQTAQRAAIAPGQVITAQQRPYGIAFTAFVPQAERAEPFFLVLDDAWYRELDSRPIAG